MAGIAPRRGGDGEGNSIRGFRSGAWGARGGSAGGWRGPVLERSGRRAVSVAPGPAGSASGPTVSGAAAGPEVPVSPLLAVSEARPPGHERRSGASGRGSRFGSASGKGVWMRPRRPRPGRPDRGQDPRCQDHRRIRQAPARVAPVEPRARAARRTVAGGRGAPPGPRSKRDAARAPRRARGHDRRGHVVALSRSVGPVPAGAGPPGGGRRVAPRPPRGPVLGRRLAGGGDPRGGARGRAPAHRGGPARSRRGVLSDPPYPRAGLSPAGRGRGAAGRRGRRRP